jgi:hypothetical protein
MTTQTPPRTHCPNCGAKLHRQDLSLCAYCATPLSLGGKVDRPSDETTRRLQRLREKPEFSAAMAWKPFDPQVLAQMNRSSSAGWALLFLSAALAIVRLLIGRPIHGTGPLMIATGVAAVLGALLLLRSSLLRSRERGQALVRRPALVLDRRSETNSRGGRAVTTYFFTMRFDDGSEGEFRWLGQGTGNEPLSGGVTGIAYTRRQELVEFRRM